MSTPEHSGKPLVGKLGFQPGDDVFVETTPDWYSSFADEHGIELSPDLPATHAHLFFASKSELAQFLEDYDINEVAQSLWLSWPKKASGVQTDLTERDLRDAIIPLGWVDVKVAAIDSTWSGLKFLRRKN